MHLTCDAVVFLDSDTSYVCPNAFGTYCVLLGSENIHLLECVELGSNDWNGDDFEYDVLDRDGGDDF